MPREIPDEQPDGAAEEARFRTAVTLSEQGLTSPDELRVHFHRTERRSVDRPQLIREAIRRYHGKILAY